MPSVFCRIVHLFSRSGALLVLMLGIGACSSSPLKSDSLYQSLGDAEGTARLVDALVERLYTDTRIAFLF